MGWLISVRSSWYHPLLRAGSEVSLVAAMMSRQSGGDFLTRRSLKTERTWGEIRVPYLVYSSLFLCWDCNQRLFCRPAMSPQIPLSGEENQK